MKPYTVFSALAFSLAVLTTPVLAGEGVKITSLVQGSKTLNGKKIVYPKTENAEMTAIMAEIAPGAEIGLHMHPVPLVVYVLQGTLDVEIQGGEKHQIEEGKAFLEVVNTWHNGINRGNTPVKLLVVFAGEVGKKNLIRAEVK